MKVDAGRLDQGDRLLLNSSAMTNFHINIVGGSGMGKSYFLSNLIRQVVSQGGCVMVFDASHDWIRKKDHSELALNNIQVVNIRSPALSFNPLHPRVRASGMTELPSDVGQRVARTLTSAYSLREAQTIYLSNAITTYLCDCEGRGCTYSLPGLIDFMQRTPEIVLQTAVSIGRLINLVNTIPCGEEQTVWSVDEPGLTILDFQDVGDEKQQVLITELIVDEIWEARLKSNRDEPAVLVFDEAQKFRFKEGSVLVKLLREGRKFNLSGWFASQYIPKNTVAADALELAAFRPIFRPVPRLGNEIARMLGYRNRRKTQDIGEELSRLQRGQYLVQDVSGEIHKIYVDQKEEGNVLRK